MKELGYYNGEYGPLSEMRIPMTDRVCVFGDGVYDAAMGRNGKIFALPEHIDRIFNGMAALKINPPCSKQEMAHLLLEMLGKVDQSENLVYWQVTRGSARREHSFDPAIKANLWIMVYPDKADPMDREFSAITHEDTRFLHCNIKTLNLLPSVMYAQAAREAGVDEAILYRADGHVTECAHSNVHILKDGVLITHPADNLILPGIARAHLIAVCRKLGIGVAEAPFTVQQMFDADEVIITSSGSFAMRVSTVDGKPVGHKDGATLGRIQQALDQEFYTETA
ncbi:MAG: aminotransferase class IV [Eggerthellaceae bacterium]|jgi:D-alanine transaminase